MCINIVVVPQFIATLRLVAVCIVHAYWLLNYDGGYDAPDCWITTYKKIGAHNHPTTS